MEKSCVTVSIFGSCVSRDVFEFEKAGSKRLKVSEYIARQSIISGLSKPMKCKLEDVDLESKFQQRLVYYDLAKLGLDQLAKSKSEYCMIDFIDERLNLGQLEGTLVTLSAEFLKSKFKNLATVVRREKKQINNGKIEYYVQGVCIKEYIEKFIEQIRLIYSEDQIIIHKARTTEYYFNQDKDRVRFDERMVKYYQEVNLLVDYMYDYMMTQLPNARVIDVSEKYIGTWNHKWGKSPMHYQNEYYLDVLQHLYTIFDIEESEK